MIVKRVMPATVSASVGGGVWQRRFFMMAVFRLLSFRQTMTGGGGPSIVVLQTNYDWWRGPLLGLLALVDPVAGLYGVLDLGEHPKVAPILGRSHQWAEKAVVDTISKVLVTVH